MPDIYKNQIIEDDEESVLISDGLTLPGEPPAEDEESPAEEESSPKNEIPQGYAIYSPEELEQKISQRVERLREQWWEEACLEASEKKGGEIQACIHQIQGVLRTLEENQREFLEGYRDHLASLAADIAEKLILHKIDEDDLYLKALVMKTVGSVKNAEWITVEVSNQLVNLVEQLRQEFKNGDYGNVEVAARYHPEDTCLMETDEGVLDASISEQIRNLKKAFESIAL